MMVLVDTSVWIDLFRNRRSEPVLRLRRILDSGDAFALTPVIVQEVLQSAASEREFSLLHDYFTTQRMIIPADPVATHCRAARLYFDCRRRGFTPRSTVGCLIAQIAVEHNLIVLHNDQDFERIAAVAPQLKLS
jgi:predicted nucleic acid-binding protein